MDNLKPCPFCGGEAHTYKTIAQRYCAICNEPFCANVGPFDTEAEAIAAWNTRAETSYEDALILLDELGLSERTCRDASVDSSAQFYCSECECTVDIPILWGVVNYCPNCGARVIGAGEQTEYAGCFSRKG